MVTHITVEFVQTHRIENTKSESQWKLSTLGENDLSTYVVNYNKRTTLLGDVDRRKVVGQGDRGIWEFSVLSALFCCRHETAVKIIN